jgi:hypothetical protein
LARRALSGFWAFDQFTVILIAQDHGYRPALPIDDKHLVVYGSPMEKLTESDFGICGGYLLKIFYADSRHAENSSSR